MSPFYELKHIRVSETLKGEQEKTIYGILRTGACPV